MTRRASRLAGLAAVALLSGVGTVAAQTPATPRPDSVRPDTLRPDTLRRAAVDSLVTELGRGDSLVARLRRLPGFQVVEYSGRRATFKADSQQIRLFGTDSVRAKLQRVGADEVEAREITYDGASGEVVATGRVLGQTRSGGQTGPIRGDTVRFNLASRELSAAGTSTELTQNGTAWKLLDADVRYDSLGVARISQAKLTSDDRGGDSIPAEQLQYHFRAGKLVVLRERLIVGAPVTLYFRNVPVARLPFIYQDLTRGRKSGILTPQFRLNDIVQTGNRTAREIDNLGVFWAINEYLGAQAAYGWRSGSYQKLSSNLQFRDRNRFLDGGLTLNQFWRDNGSSEQTAFGNLAWQPAERTSVRGELRYASSEDFIRRNTIDPREARQSLLSSIAGNRRFGWGSADVGVSRDQQVTTGDVTLTGPRLGVTVNPITFLRASSPDRARWYNDATLDFSGTAGRTSTDLALPDSLSALSGDSLARRGIRRDQTQGQAQIGSRLQLGNLSISGSGNLNRTELAAFTSERDTVGLIETLPDDLGAYNFQLGYQQNLTTFFGLFSLGRTRFTPSLSYDQNFARSRASRRDSLIITRSALDTARRDTVQVLGSESFLTSPARLNANAALATDLYGFFPGVGSFEAFRHRISPQLSYQYSPDAALDPRQRIVFGGTNALARNQLTFGFANSFEGKLRPQSVRTQQPDSMSDTTGVGGAARTAPAPNDAQKVVLLTINTSSFTYDFERARGDTLSGWSVQTVQNDFTSDYLRGFTVGVSHDLFDENRPRRPPLAGTTRRPGDEGSFDPHLSQVNASFGFGSGSSLFRWLGLSSDDDDDNQRGGRQQVGQQPGLIPGGTRSVTGFGAQTTGSFNDNGQTTGSGPWQANISYAYSRPRDVPGTTAVPSAGSSRLVSGYRTGETQTLNLNTNFSLSPNWAVSWQTSYSVTDGKFADQSVNLRRNLFRWQANFDFYRTIAGNTSFSFAVRLIDLPDLKFDYREREIGLDRPAGEP